MADYLYATTQDRTPNISRIWPGINNISAAGKISEPEFVNI
jgi:hypothetical protein